MSTSTPPGSPEWVAAEVADLVEGGHLSDCDERCNGDWCHCPCHKEEQQPRLELGIAEQVPPRAGHTYTGICPVCGVGH